MNRTNQDDMNRSELEQALRQENELTFARPSSKPHLEEDDEPAKKSSKKDEPPPFGSEDKELFESRTILISAPVDAKLSHAINGKLLAMEKVDAKKPIFMYINSPGGEIHSGFSIFDTARFIQPPVITIVSGLAASMGSIISLCADKKNRFAFPNSKFLVHQPSISGGLGGSVSDIEIHAKDLIDTKDRIIQLYCDETGRTEPEVRKALNRDTWLSPEAALAFGLISKIITKRKDLPF
jgi:ATP-dependent Clp protease, protease subunit